jgi:hypothetical protein
MGALFVEDRSNRAAYRTFELRRSTRHPRCPKFTVPLTFDPAPRGTMPLVLATPCAYRGSRLPSSSFPASGLDRAWVVGSVSRRE